MGQKQEPGIPGAANAGFVSVNLAQLLGTPRGARQRLSATSSQTQSS